MNDQSLRVGEISFTNCENIFYYLKNRYCPPGISYQRGAPAVLNRMLRNGELDLSLSSSIEYASEPGQYLVLPGFGIGSKGELPSIRLFSRIPLDALDGSRIGLTDESATTVALCRVILGKLLGYTNNFLTIASNLESAMEQVDAMVLIGDKGLEADSHADTEDLFSYDLSMLWQQYTGLPFVFALWILRKDAAARLGGLLTGFWRALGGVHRDIALPDDELIEQVLATRPFLNRESLLAYWNTLAYRLSPRHMEGLRLFYRLSAEEGLLESAPEIELFDPAGQSSVA
jgi:chorismate dehydratase